MKITVLQIAEAHDADPVKMAQVQLQSAKDARQLLQIVIALVPFLLDLHRVLQQFVNQ